MVLGISRMNRTGHQLPEKNTGVFSFFGMKIFLMENRILVVLTVLTVSAPSGSSRNNEELGIRNKARLAEWSY